MVGQTKQKLLISLNLDEHLHDYNHPSSQQVYSSNRLDNSQQQQSSTRSQTASSFSSRPPIRPSYSPS